MCVVYSCLGRGDVLALHSCALEIGESLHCVRVMFTEDSLVGCCHLFEYCHGL